ncbi:MAG: rhamnulokinase [Hespellia sp.]|nr:rhamnulokinase [Hespellia sp.]
MERNYMIVDLGASNGRVIVAAYQGDKFSFDIVHRFDNVPVFANEGEYFWDILHIFSDIKVGIRKALEKYPDIVSVAIDTMGCDFGFVSANGRLMGNPTHYRDESQHKMAEKLHSILSEEELFELSQGPCNRIMGIYKLFSLKERHTFEYEHAKYLLMIPDLLNFLLTGKITNEFTNATMTLMVNQKDRCWEEKICDKLDLRKDIFTPLTEPGTNIGPIRESICKELGIRPINVVVPATHDTASAVAGIPVTQQDKNWAFVSLGTWALAGIEMDEPFTDSRVVPLEFGNEGGVEGKSMLLKNINGLWVIQRCRQRWNEEAGEEVSWNDITKAANEAKEITSVFDVDDEEFSLFQSNMPKTIQDYCKRTGQEIPETMGEIARCAYLSLAMKTRDCLHAVYKIIGKDLELLHLLGGGTQNRLLCQWISNAVGVPIVAGPTETTSVGNLIFQLLADKQIASVEEGRALCAASSNLYTCEPDGKREYWDDIYAHYVKIVK